MPVEALKHLMQHDPDLWLRQSVQYFQTFGLLTISEEQAREAMLSGWGEIIPDGAGDKPHFADMFLLAECRAPVWWADLECIYPNADGYADLLREWAAVSRGSFAPEDIAERWAADQRSAEVTFTFNGARHHFAHVERNGDFVDMAIVRLINGLIYRSPYQFEVCDMGMPNFVIALNAAEKTRLTGERGWQFEDQISGSRH